MWPGEGCEQVWRILGEPDLAACWVEATCPDARTWGCMGRHCTRVPISESIAHVCCRNMLPKGVFIFRMQGSFGGKPVKLVDVSVD